MNILISILAIVGAIVILPILFFLLLFIISGIVYTVGMLIALTHIAIKEFVEWLNGE